MSTKPPNLRGGRQKIDQAGGEAKRRYPQGLFGIIQQQHAAALSVARLNSFILHTVGPDLPGLVRKYRVARILPMTIAAKSLSQAP